jgi:hypothetical protein
MLPPLTEQELRELGEDIKARGLLHRIFIFEEPVGRSDGSKEYRYSLLDGVSRLDVWNWSASISRSIATAPMVVGLLLIEASTTCGRRPHSSVLVSDDPFAFVLSVNLHRRHLTVEQKRDLIAKVLKAQPSKSNRQVAKTVGVSHPYVAAVRAELEKSGDVETVTTSIDTKGRKQPARKPAKKKRRNI